VLELAGEAVQQSVAANLVVLIGEGSGDDEDEDRRLRCESVEHMVVSPCDLLPRGVE